MQPTANQMTVEQALNILSQVASQFKGTLQDHQTIIKAFEVIKKTLDEPKIQIKADKIEEVSN